jgi:hypothetical protein
METGRDMFFGGNCPCPLPSHNSYITDIGLGCNENIALSLGYIALLEFFFKKDLDNTFEVRYK